MKKIFLLITGFVCVSLYAQENKTMLIKFEHRQEIDPKSVTVNGVSGKEVEKEQIKFANEIANEILDYQLTLNQNESYYEFLPKISNNQDGSITTYGDDGEMLYKNLRENFSIKTVSFPKKFLIRDSLRNYNWQILNETKEICGQQTQKAISELGDSIKIEAWFSPKLNYKNGPDLYEGLPGLILKVNKTAESKIEGWSKEKIICTTIEIIKEKKSFKKPNKGKVVTPKEYDDICDEFEAKYLENNNNGVEVSM
ncbi:GLPGLI family protein [Empedobacter brevis]|uniref:GLPGLI family protein n=1 Tax=Empedobacter brevis TaxID=247 RepID=UPI00123DD82A|nr:GLPGLI family protein [Empedobacter brevis]QES91450.1 GLPGLI family protein [Empedobacter brevis]